MQFFHNFLLDNFSLLHTFQLFPHRPQAKIQLNNVFITKYGPSMGSCDKNAVMVPITFRQLQQEQTKKCRKLHEKPGKLHKRQR